MKSSRLLTMLLLLQTRERMTTRELSDRLEVSGRTVLRDVEALSAAGVPVYAERGRHGGIVLLPGARLNVAQLNPQELEAISVAGLDARHRAELGMAAAHEAAAQKIAARRATAGTPGVSLADLVLVDNTGWFAAVGEGVDVGRFALDLRGSGRLRIRYRRSGAARPSSYTVDPYGLVAKAGRWYLVADHRGAPRLFNLERLVGYRLLPEAGRTRPNADLASVWEHLKHDVESSGDVVVTARLRASRVDLARRILGARLVEVSVPEDGWCRVRLRYPDVEAVRQLLQFGDHVEVLAPPAARARVAELATDLARRHGLEAHGRPADRDRSGGSNHDIRHGHGTGPLPIVDSTGDGLVGRR